MELQDKISHVNVPESSSKGFDTPQILNTGKPVEHVDIEDVTDEEFPPLNCPAPKAVPQTSGNLHSNTHEHYITAFRTYVKHLLSLGKTEEAIEVALKYSPKSIQTPLLVESEKSADLFVEPDKSVALFVEPEKSTGGIANSTVKKNTVSIDNGNEVPKISPDKNMSQSEAKATPNLNKNQVQTKTSGQNDNRPVGLPSRLSYAQTVTPQQQTNGGLKLVLPDRNIIMHRDTPTVRFAEEEVEHFSKVDRFTLVGKFSHGQPKLDVIKKHFATQYLLKGQDLPTLNPQAPEFNPTQYALGVLKEVPLQSIDQNPQNMSILFPVIPTNEIPKQLTCGENTLAKSIPSNTNVMLEEIDPGPQTAENAIEEVWSDEGYASPIGEEDSLSSPVFDPKSKKVLNDISLDVPAANTRKGSSKAKPHKTPTTKKSGRARTSSPPPQ
ncbi:unnamed protein product [Cuscuta campestris]|uniref:Uncharacterized protein n=1 Tax=Cuscuta campestris TaxID=132261 RepID=A0A484KTD5_9ASTE|nr:unnamed protein product [Cuscuta campestris]